MPLQVVKSEWILVNESFENLKKKEAKFRSWYVFHEFIWQKKRKVEKANYKYVIRDMNEYV